MTNDKNIIIHDDQDSVDMVYDISDRIFELRDALSIDIISKNIIDRFDTAVDYETTNYVTKFKDTYDRLKDTTLYEGDINILNNALQELSEIIVVCLKNKYCVGVGEDIDDDLTTNLNEFLNKIETLYEFFVIRNYTNIKDYFKTNLIQHKTDYIEKYKAAIDDKSIDDLFLNQDKKKYKDTSDAIIIHYINDIINDIKAEITSSYDFFKDIVNLDLFEEYNNRMYNLLINYGTDFVIYDDTEAVKKYLSILDKNEIFVALRNDLLSDILIDVKLN